jgi:hypothetical protein
MTDVIVITMGIAVLAILFGPYIAISISLIKRTSTKLIKKLKISYDVLYSNFGRSSKHRFDQNAAKIVFIPVFGTFSIVSFTNLLGVNTFSLLGIIIIQNKEMMAVL